MLIQRHKTKNLIEGEVYLIIVSKEKELKQTTTSFNLLSTFI